MHADPTSFDIDTQPFSVFGGDACCPTCGNAFSSLLGRCPHDESELICPPYSSTDSLLGTVLDGRYRLTSQLAEGAMGIVYEGVQLSVRRPVAIKVIREELGRDLTITQRFLREARLLTSITHPNVVEVYDYGETESGCLYLVMELLRGNTLDAILAAEGPFSVQRTCEIGMQLCNALTAAHAQGVVHRDLKPANLIVLPGLGDWVKVVDFGLAKRLGDPGIELTYTGAVLGTPLYMAPEAIRCDAADPRSDLYALGCILHELLTGAAPFMGETSALVLARQLDDTPPALPSGVPATLRKLVSRLLAKSPSDRPASARAVRDSLESCLGCDDAPTMEPGGPAPTGGTDVLHTTMHAALLPEKS